MEQKPLTVFADLGARSDLLWGHRLLRAIRRCEQFNSMSCRLKGGSLLVPYEAVVEVTYGERTDGMRRREVRSEGGSQAFYLHQLGMAVADTEPLTDFDTTELLKFGHYDWDVFTISDVADDVVEDLLASLNLEAGFLHAARVNTNSPDCYHFFWQSLMLYAIASEGVILDLDTEDDPTEALRDGYVENRERDFARDVADGVFVDFFDTLLPERRWARIPMSLPLRYTGAPGAKRRRPRHDAVTRASSQLPSSISKSHKFDVHAEPAVFDLPRFPADRMPDYFQVEAKVAEYCLRDARKLAGFEDLRIFATDAGVAQLADQLLAVINDRDAELCEPRVMSDGTLQFSQQLVVTGPTGRMGSVEAAWFMKPGDLLRLSSAHRIDTADCVAQPHLLPVEFTRSPTPEGLVSLAASVADSAAEGVAPVGQECAGIVVVPFVDPRSFHFGRWTAAHRDLEVTIEGGAKLAWAVIAGLVAGEMEAEVVARLCATVDVLRSAGVRAYPLVADPSAAVRVAS